MCKCYIFIIAFLISFIDQVSKIVILNLLKTDDCIIILKNFFNIIFLKNTGVIFGTLKGNNKFLIAIVSIFILAFIVYIITTREISEFRKKIALGLILGGAIGNLIDRIFRGGVIDFLDFYISDYHWPAFNIADSSISIGIILLIYVSCFIRSN